MSWLRNPFTRKAPVDTAGYVAQLQVDIHSHLIPGVDDGAATTEESLALIRRLVALGYRGAITTPHIHAEQYLNESSDLRSRAQQLQYTLKAEGIAFQLEVAAEYYYDAHFEKLIAQDDLMTIGPARYLLFETSHYERPMRLEYGLFDLINKRIKPILAHPERYAYGWNNTRFYHEMVDRGVVLQLNLNSLTGVYSPVVKKTAHYLLRQGLVSFLGSDAHHMHHLELLPRALADPELHRYLERHTPLNVELLAPLT